MVVSFTKTEKAEEGIAWGIEEHRSSAGKSDDTMTQIRTPNLENKNYIKKENKVFCA